MLPLTETYLTITVFMFILLVLCVCNDTKDAILPKVRGAWLLLTMLTISFIWPIMIVILFLRAIAIILIRKSN